MKEEGLGLLLTFYIGHKKVTHPRKKVVYLSRDEGEYEGL